MATPPLIYDIICALSIKPAQRISAVQLAENLKRDEREMAHALEELELIGLTRTWPDGSYGLTPNGNFLRSQLV